MFWQELCAGSNTQGDCVCMVVRMSRYWGDMHVNGTQKPPLILMQEEVNRCAILCVNGID
jgi:hypothetical protein